jgi:hypothetical protein
MNTINNNIIQFPRVLGARFRANPNNRNNTNIDTNSPLIIPSSEDVDSIDNFIFYGDKLVLKFVGEPSVSDMWLYFQLIEAFQKTNISFENKDENSKKELEDKEISASAKNELVREYRIVFKKELSYLDTTEEKNSFLRSKVDEEIEKRKLKIDRILYLNSPVNVVVDIDINMLLKERGLTINLHNKESIVKSLERLNNIGLSWYVLNDNLSEEFKKVKQKYNNNSSLYLEELRDLFKRRIHKTNMYFRHLLNGVNITKEMSSAKIRIDKGFFDLTLRSERFDFSIFKKLEGNISKTLFVNLSYAYKNIVSKEYIYNLLSLEENRRDDKKLLTVKNAIQDLIKNEVLSDKSGYDKENKVFKLELNEEFYVKSGLKAKSEYIQKTLQRKEEQKKRIQRMKGKKS